MSETLDRPTETLAIRTLSFLSGDGDNTYGWDAKDDVWVIPMIQKKMDEGYVFWIVRKDPIREVRLRTASEATATRDIIIKDADARILFEQGRIGIATLPMSERQRETVRERRAETAADAAAHDTVAHRPLARG